MSLVLIDDFDNFKAVKYIPPEMITEKHLKTVRSLDEREELEPFIRSILHDPNETPHGPAEIVDIFTHKVSVNRRNGLAAFIIKGKSFPKVRSENVSHQIYRLEKIADLRYAIFMASGIVLDSAKEQFCSTAERINTNYAIFDSNDIARLLIAYGFLCPKDAQKIIGGRCKCGYSPKKRELNLLQKESIKAIKEAHDIGQKAGIIILPTGSGKTRIAAQDVSRIDIKHLLYVAHTQEILDVAEREFEDYFPKEKITRHLAGSSLNTPNVINISTIQLLSRNLISIKEKYFDYVVIDEFHHAAAKSYKALLKKAKPNFLLGLTATPFRSDRKDILELCNNNVLANFELRTGIDYGILSPYHYFGCFDDIDYSKISHNGLQYNVKDLERALVIPEREEAIIKKWRELADEKPTIAFCRTQKHATRVAQSFRRAGIPAEIYVSSTDSAERKELIEKLKYGDLKILCVVDVLNEGADIPFVECLLFLRPTESKLLFYQQLGRGLRRSVGKSHCIVIDFIGNFKNAYKILEYQSLLDDEENVRSYYFATPKTFKEIFNLPLGCEVNLDDKVIELFAAQALDPKYATKSNIGKILVYHYQKLARYLRKNPTRKDMDRISILPSSLYVMVFGSWSNFERIMKEKFGK